MKRVYIYLRNGSVAQVKDDDRLEVTYFDGRKEEGAIEVLDCNHFFFNDRGYHNLEFSNNVARRADIEIKVA